MAVHPLAGKPAPPELWIDVSALELAYYRTSPEGPVQFGTSGHRGTPRDGTFTEAHILAIAQAICDFRRSQGIDGPLFLGKDTHALSAPAQRTALEVLAANGVETYLQRDDGATPTPVISHAILAFNSKAGARQADGIVVTPSHNPPSDGGFKYNPPHGGPADTDVTGWIERRANELLSGHNRAVKRVPFERALKAPATHLHDFVRPYVADLPSVVDLEAIRSAGLKLGADPLGGSSVHYWEPIAETYGLDITVVNPKVDPAFRFMMVDHDGRIRMDCSSPYAMAGLVQLKERYDVAFGNDPDADRHGVVSPLCGLMNPNHYLAVAVWYLLSHRPEWPASAAVGKTLVSSAMIDRVTRAAGREVAEAPVGFKWFARELHSGAYCFGGEESAGASFLRRNGSVWVTDKDGILMDLLAAEILACTGKDPGANYRDLEERFEVSYYTRIDTPATPQQKAALKKLSADSVQAATLAGDRIVARLTRAPANGASIEGLKVVTESGWFAARPSGTENICKLYAESFRSREHLDAIVSEARAILERATA